ncbi:MAG: 50S ribosomal protein L3 [Acidilobaceae archaeon]
MGARKKSAPKRGSLGFTPRKRAEKIVPRVRSWPEVNLGKPLLLGFLGYKVGMTHVYMVDDLPDSPTSGREIFVPVTVVETPPLYVLAVRLYGFDLNKGLYSMGEAWVEPPKELELERRIPTLGSYNTEARLKELEESLELARAVRVIVASQTKLTGGLSKKAPDLLEVEVGGVGDVKSLFSYAVGKLGKEVSIREVFQVGQPIDVIGVTKGKGFQGVVKRWGVKELPRWHKHRKGSRTGPGARSSAIGTFWETPQPGQMGFHRRTDYNKRLLSISQDGHAVTPAGGFLHYGLVRSEYAIVAGSLPGTVKRPLVLRWPIRPPSWYLRHGTLTPKIVHVSVQSKQGN